MCGVSKNQETSKVPSESLFSRITEKNPAPNFVLLFLLFISTSIIGKFF